MTIDRHTCINPDTPGVRLGHAWDVYRNTFEPLAHLGANRAMLNAGEFVELAGNPLIDKYVAHDDHGTIIGVGAVTSRLDVVPFIAPAYFRHHWPVEYEQARIWYVSFIATATPGVFRELLLAMTRPARASGGLIFMDFCDHTVDDRALPEAIADVLARATPGLHTREVDAQRLHLFAFDEPGDDDA